MLNFVYWWPFCISLFGFERSRSSSGDNHFWSMLETYSISKFSWLKSPHYVHKTERWTFWKLEILTFIFHNQVSAVSHWQYREWSNIITCRAVSIKTGRSNILSRLEVTVKWYAWTVFKYLFILFQNGRQTEPQTTLNVEVPAYKYAAPKNHV